LIRAGIIGATGYTGAELIRLLHGHPEVEIAILTSRSYVGEDISNIYPNLKACVRRVCEDQDLDKVVAVSDVIFVALPHGHAVPIVQKAVAAGKKVIDLGADFRLKDANVYKEWYGLEHGAPDMLEEVVYGIPEIYRKRIAVSRVVANPGCYPTSIILGLAPLLHNGLIKLSGITADSKSGVSGAGKAPSEKTHFVECNENISAYGVSGHRHRPEIEQELSFLAGRKVRISFTPHLLPITRGILSTIYADLTSDVDEKDLRKIYSDFYSEAPFVRVLPEGMWPHTRWVYGSNYCHINFAVDKEIRRITILSAIDNLVKGASGQAIQNMNLMLGLREDTGLNVPGIYP